MQDARELKDGDGEQVMADKKLTMMETDAEQTVVIFQGDDMGVVWT